MVSEQTPAVPEKTEKTKEEKLVPAKDLDNLRSSLQKQIAEQAQQHKAELQRIREEADQARQEAADLAEVANLEQEDRTKLLNFRRVERDLKKQQVELEKGKQDVLNVHRYLQLQEAKANLLKEYPEVSMEDIAEAPDIQSAELLALRKARKTPVAPVVNRQETGEAKATPTAPSKVLFRPTGDPRIQTLEFPDK